MLSDSQFLPIPTIHNFTFIIQHSQCVPPVSLGYPASAECSKRPDFLTRPTLARQDAPCPKQGRSERRGEAYPCGTLSP